MPAPDRGLLVELSGDNIISESSRSSGTFPGPPGPFSFPMGSSGKWHCSLTLFRIPANLLLPTDPPTPRTSSSDPGSSLRGSGREELPPGRCYL